MHHLQLYPNPSWAAGPAPRHLQHSAAGCTVQRSTTAAAAVAARQNRPTRGKPPRASITPPSAAPPTAPSWLLTARSPVAVAGDGPATSSNSTAITVQAKDDKPVAPP